MSIKLHNLQSSTQKKKKKRVGRGNSSGHGTYSTRGLKGQKSRSGVSGLKLKGMKRIILATPKLRGFKSIYPKTQTITLGRLNKFFKNGDIVNPENLLSKKLVDTKTKNIKIVSRGELTMKLIVKDCKISKSAKEKIESLGGEIE
ncbi:50S ribosomal protein L15 [Patescibacteria group bacterium]|nr:50S ribosomal protein L15 [Patescibacteria group bacterium]